ncbi:MAG: hypothetical protein ACOC5A_04445 [Halanaerobiales bacterium]
MKKILYTLIAILIIGVAGIFIYTLFSSGIDPGVPAGAVKI